MVKCLTQENNSLVTAWLEPTTFVFRVSALKSTAPHEPMLHVGRLPNHYNSLQMTHCLSVDSSRRIKFAKLIAYCLSNVKPVSLKTISPTVHLSMFIL